MTNTQDKRCITAENHTLKIVDIYEDEQLNLRKETVEIDNTPRVAYAKFWKVRVYP